MFFLKPVVYTFGKPTMRANGTVDRTGNGRIQFCCVAPKSVVSGHPGDMINGYEKVLCCMENKHRDEMCVKDEDYKLGSLSETAQYALCKYKGRIKFMSLLGRYLIDAADDLFESVDDVEASEGLDDYVYELIREYARYCYINTEFMVSLLSDTQIESVADTVTREKMNKLITEIYFLKDHAFDLLAFFDEESEGILFYYNLNGNEYKNELKLIRRAASNIAILLEKISIIRLPYNHIWYTDGGQGVAESELMVQYISLIFCECFGILTKDRYHNAGIFCTFYKFMIFLYLCTFCIIYSS